MSLICGLVGLPNVGKSSLFNAILRKAVAASENYPFCTIEPNKGTVPVKDPRLEVLAKISKTKTIIPTTITCMDIAGLVKGASEGAGLGNQFLGHIRTSDLIIQVIRCFEDKSITHVEGSVDPLRDYEIITLELIFSDIEKLEKILKEKKYSAKQKSMAQLAKETLDKNILLNTADFDSDCLNFFEEQGLLTHKPMLVAANLGSNEDLVYLEKIKHLNPVPVFIYVEVLSQEIPDEEERKIFIQELGVENSNLDLLIQKAYSKLGLISYFTTGEKETRAWKVKNGSNMQQAAGVIHTDFYDSFISSEVVKYEDFVASQGWTLAKEKGLVKTCSKDTIVQDGDICIFKTYK